MRNYFVRFVLSYLRFFARRALRKSPAVTIGIAGSVGKSSAKKALYAILKDHGKTVALDGNSETGIPLSILGLKNDDYSVRDWLRILLHAPLRTNNLIGVKYLIIEMGIDEPDPPKNMSYLLTIVKPDIAINLNVSATHSMQFEKALKTNEPKTVERLVDRIAAEDTKIITQSGARIGIYNSNDPAIVRHITSFRKKNSETTLVSFGESKEDKVSLVSYAVTPKKTSFTFLLREKKEYELTITLRNFTLPRAYASTLSAVILAARMLKVPLKDIEASIEKNFSLPPGRATLFNGVHDSLIIDSTYNASKESMITFLDLLKELKRVTKRRAIFIFGDMRELGGIAHEEHKIVAEKALAVADHIYCVGPLTREYAVPLFEGRRGKKIDWYKSAVQLGLHLKETLPANSIVLVKGSQNEIFLEEAVKFLLSDTHDEKQLCRQSEFWKERKASYFSLNSN